MLIPVATWSECKLRSFNSALDELTRQIEAGEKITRKTIRKVAQESSQREDPQKEAV